MPSLLKASNLASAHIIRGRLDAEGHHVGVVHENASNLWGGAVVGGPVLVAPAAAFPEIAECVATAEQVDPPPDAHDDGLPHPPASPGITGSALLGACLVAIALAVEMVGANLVAILNAITSTSHYHSGPIPFRFPDPALSLGALGLGAAAGAAIHLARIALRKPVWRIIIATFILVPFLHPPALLIAAGLVLIEWVASSCTRESRRQ